MSLGDEVSVLPLHDILLQNFTQQKIQYIHIISITLLLSVEDKQHAWKCLVLIFKSYATHVTKINHKKCL